jgi:TetR/AcrR family transcriptional regulator, cholesterol catabolism regulator
MNRPHIQSIMSETTSTIPRTRRQAQADARREQLLATALECFSRKGVRGSTIRDIAQAAGVTEGLIYHYFPSKPALFQAVMERFSPAEEMATVMSELKGVPARAAFTRLGRRFLELLARHRKIVTMVHAELYRDPDVAKVMGQTIAPAFQAGCRFIEERIAAGELRPHDATISLRLFHNSLLWFFVMQPKLSPPLPPMDGETFIRGAVDVLLNGIASPGGATCDGD